jgi:leucyl/phenylalanyl-tRNA---protein transferase
MAQSPDELVAVGGDLSPQTLLAGYIQAMFPMPLPDGLQVEGSDYAPIGWWSPNPRGILPLDALKVSRSLRKSCERFTTTINTAFPDVIISCADPDRPHGWIDDDIIDAYIRLHELGWAHSVETWEDDTLVGGLYGVAIAGFFAGESMFHKRTDASKVALVRLVHQMNANGFALLDIQWLTPHLANLGATEVAKDDYMTLLGSALAVEAEALDTLH